MNYQPRYNVVHRSLQGAPFLLGVEKPLAVLNGTLGLALSVAAGTAWLLLISVFTHLLLKNLNRKDPCIRKIYLKSAVQGDFYDPWIHVAEPDRTKRRPGFGRGMLC